MAIRSFDVGGLRGLKRAAATALPNLVVIAGPNGAGKSSLLDLLRAQRHQIAQPGTEVMFVGPHRTWRSSQLNRVSVYGYAARSYGELLMSDAMPNFQYVVPPGLQGLQGQGRQSSSADDVQAFVKTSLVKLRDRQQNLIGAAFAEQGGKVAEGSVPDLFVPFENLVTILLPHLRWVGVVEQSPENIQCLFRAVDQSDLTFDIDELSSGEKAAIALMLPLVERQAKELEDSDEAVPDMVPLTMLLDEPELHLHPLLQLQMLEYLREQAHTGKAQFILTTHSTSLLDALEEAELWLLSPASIRPENQLTQLTTSAERLEVARTLTGSTHALTRAKPIVFVEGEDERTRIASDARVMTSTLPTTRSWALVPSKEKAEVVRSVVRLRQESLEMPGMPVFGIVDADRDETTGSDHVVQWPVAMVENLLLDPETIWTALKAYGRQTAATSPDAVQNALDELVAARIDEEVQLRVRRHLPVGRLTFDLGSAASVDQQAEAQGRDWTRRVNMLDVSALEARAREDVDKIVREGSGLERFHGKRLLRGVYDKLRVSAAGLSHSAFVLSIAAHAAGTDRVSRLASATLEQIQLFFPDGIGTLLAQTGTEHVSELAARCAEHRTAWESGAPISRDRESLRAELFAFAADHEAIRSELAALASEIGTLN